MSKRTAAFLVLIPGALLLVIVVRTARFQPVRYPAVDTPVVVIDGVAAAERLAEAIRFPTVTSQDAALVDSAAFLGLHRFMQESYPLVHAELGREIISGLSLLYTWRGRNERLAPAVLMAHLDVVPAPGDSWTHPPFSGVIDDEYVWGRGALDDKVGVVAILEAVEAQLRDGFVPERTFYLLFGHDEEGGGKRGAAVMADTVMSRSSSPPAFVLDEGGMVGVDLLMEIEAPVALIGIAEKGYLSVELTASGKGGHSSAPPSRTAVGRVAEAVSKLELNPFPPRVDGAAEAMLRHIGPYMDLPKRGAMANMWLFRGIVAGQMASNPQSAPAVRTTTAPTMLAAGVRENVLPERATAVVNFRILPGDSIASVMEHARQAIDDDYIEVRPINVYFDPSPVADIRGPQFAMVAQAVLESIPTDDPVIAPYLVPGATDSRYFAPYTESVYRFMPVTISATELSGFHGVDERVRISSLRAAATYFARVIQKSQTLSVGDPP